MKKLVAPGDGLLQTHLTWADVEEEAKIAFNTTHKFGPNRSVKNISLGKGSLSRLAYIEPDWVTCEENHDLPKSFVVKKSENGGFWAMAPEVEAMWERKCRILHNTECTIYETISRLAAEKINIPKIFAISPFSEQNPLKGNIMMEFVQSDDFRIEDNMSFESFKPILRYIACIQVMGAKLDEATKAKIPEDTYYETLVTIFPPETRAAIIQQFRRMDDGSLPAASLDKLAYIIDRMITADYLKKLNTIPGIPTAFCHGDFWPSNVLWNGHHVRAIIDWQTCHYGNLATDLCRFLSCAMSGRERRENHKLILKTLHEFMVEEMQGKAPLYTLEELSTAFDYIMPLDTFTGMLTLQLYFDFDKEKLKPNNMVEIAREKLHTLLEDTIAYYEKVNGIINSNK